MFDRTDLEVPAVESITTEVLLDGDDVRRNYYIGRLVGSKPPILETSSDYEWLSLKDVGDKVGDQQVQTALNNAQNLIEKLYF